MPSFRRGSGSLRVAPAGIVAACLLLGSGALCAQSRVGGKPPVQDEWMGMYFGKQKIGYTSLHTEPTTYQGKAALRQTSHEVTKLQLLGQSVEQDGKTDTITDLEEHPLSQVFEVNSNGSAIHVEAVYDYPHHIIHCTVGQGDGKTLKDVAIPPGANLTGDTSTLTEGRALVVGQKFSLSYLEPVTVTLEQSNVEVTGKQKIRDDSGREVSAFVVKASLSLGEMTSWADAAGAEIKGEINLGVATLSMVREPKERAMDPASISPAITGSVGAAGGAGKTYAPPADFAVATAISTDKTIDNPRQLHSLHVTIDGIPNEKLMISDDRQKETRLTRHPAPPYQAAVDVEAQRVETGAVSGQGDPTPAVAQYLQKAAYLPIDDPAIRKTAAEIRGAETNPYRIAVAIRNWVHAQMTPDASIGVPRSASDIYQRRRGVCRDYATLYTALARAAGVPTRLCSGIVYAMGKFYYHAWAESYAGGQWVAFDPTLYDPLQPVEYVDATHIKFAQGDVTSMFDMVSIIGRLKITVQDFTP